MFDDCFLTPNVLGVNDFTVCGLGLAPRWLPGEMLQETSCGTKTWVPSALSWALLTCSCKKLTLGLASIYQSAEIMQTLVSADYIVATAESTSLTQLNMGWGRALCEAQVWICTTSKKMWVVKWAVPVSWQALSISQGNKQIPRS